MQNYQIFKRRRQEQMSRIGTEVLDNRSVIFFLSSSQVRDIREGRRVLMKPERKPPSKFCAAITDRAYEEDKPRNLISEFGFFPVAPPTSNRKQPRVYRKVVRKAE